MPSVARISGRVSRLNCGLCRGLGTVRTPTSLRTPLVSGRPMNSSTGSVECPMVRIVTSLSTVTDFGPETPDIISPAYPLINIQKDQCWDASIFYHLMAMPQKSLKSVRIRGRETGPACRLVSTVISSTGVCCKIVAERLPGFLKRVTKNLASSSSESF
ncbi:MAG: hypothetical protein H6Q57_101 [Geobacteraceae bacterium]|nr:hypothetical protein [Geobacteraceae bacterium]